MEILIFILTLLYSFLGLFGMDQEVQKTKMDVAREKCTLLSEVLPSVIGKLGGNFNSGDLVKEFEKDSRVKNAFDRSERGDIKIGADVHSKYDENGTFGGSRIDLYFKRTPDCEISEKNCYAYITPESYEEIIYSCRFYFDEKGHVVPSESTTQFINEKEKQE